MSDTQRALQIIEQRMRECSARSEDCKRSSDETRMYQLNVAWHWLDAVRRDVAGALVSANEDMGE